MYRFGGWRGPELLELCSEDLEVSTEHPGAVSRAVRLSTPEQCTVALQASCGASCHSGDPGVSAVLLASCRWGEEGARETVSCKHNVVRCGARQQYGEVLLSTV